MTTHTPGPWVVEQNANGELAPFQTETRTHLLSGEGPLPLEERDANGRLIEAAPDLLAALQNLYDLCIFGASSDAFCNGVTDSSGTIDEGDVRASDRLSDARTAIIKAGGSL